MLRKSNDILESELMKDSQCKVLLVIDDEVKW